MDASPISALRRATDHTFGLGFGCVPVAGGRAAVGEEVERMLAVTASAGDVDGDGTPDVALTAEVQQDAATTTQRSVTLDGVDGS